MLYRNNTEKHKGNAVDVRRFPQNYQLFGAVDELVELPALHAGV